MSMNDHFNVVIGATSACVCNLFISSYAVSIYMAKTLLSSTCEAACLTSIKTKSIVLTLVESKPIQAPSW